MNLDALIELSINLFSKLFNLDLMWDYARIEESTPSEYVNSIAAAYSKDDDAIVVNPNLLNIISVLPKEYQIATVIAKVGHEARHAWQMHTNKFKETYKSYGEIGSAYVLQPEELDAFAFEEAILKIIMEDPNLEIDLKEEEKNAFKIHELSKELYLKYKDKIIEIL